MTQTTRYEPAGGPRATADAAAPGAAAPVRDAGFTLIETLVSIFVVGVVMAALTSFFVTSVSLTNQQSGLQVATQVATSASSKVRSLKGSTLVKGRDPASSHVQWNAPVPGVAPYLVDMAETWDPSPLLPVDAGKTALLPTVGLPILVNGVTYQQHWYLGNCWQPRVGGACTTARTPGDVPFFRVVIAVTWADRRCAPVDCSYVTSTLVSSSPVEPLFHANESATAPAIANPGDQAGFVGSTVSLQLTATGGTPPLTWNFTGLPPGVNGTSAGLLTGTLPATPGVFAVTATVGDGFGQAGSASFTWTVNALTYPAAVLRDSPWAYHRLDDAPSASASSAVADSSGNNRPGTHAGASTGPVTYWPFDAGSGTTATDPSGAANHGALTNGPTWTTGPTGSALTFDGSTGSVRGTQAAVHTDRDFTVAAWAYLTATNGVDHTLLSQEGAASYGFSLRHHGLTNKWSFATTSADTTNPTVIQALSPSTVQTNRWVHVAGVHDAAADTLTVYVDGVAGTPAARSTAWNARGAFAAGVRQWNGALGGFFAGSLDDARAYQRVLTAAEIANLAADPATLQWDFTEGTGTTTRDLAGGDHTGAFGSATTWSGASNGHVGNAAVFAGTATTGYVTGPRSAVHTDRSFSVAAWVYLSATDITRTAVSQTAGTVSGFYLQYSMPGGRWVFTTPHEDGLAGGDLVASTAVAAANTWVHVAGVYDAGAATIRLYVNGTSQGVAPRTAAHAWDALGAIEVGRAKYNGSAVDGWHGRIDSVRLYQRALTGTEVGALVAESTPASLTPTVYMGAGATGALRGTRSAHLSTAVAFTGTSGTTISGSNDTPLTAPAVFTLELWFRTSGTRGGVLIGYYQNRVGASPARDRQVYVDGGGRLTFGTYPVSAPLTVRSPNAYNDGAWHHVAASYGPAGLRLHVDGALVASDPSVATAGTHAGYWRWGTGDTGNWPNRPAGGDHFGGTIDEIAIYPSQLTDQQIAAHYQANT